LKNNGKDSRDVSGVNAPCPSCDLERTSGKPVEGDDLARISPLLYEHVIPSGTYFFERFGEREAAE
jgi:hypothetical protein